MRAGPQATLLLTNLQGLPMVQPQSPGEAGCWRLRTGIHAGSNPAPTSTAPPSSITPICTDLLLSLQNTLPSFLHPISAYLALLGLSGSPSLASQAD